MESKRQTKLWQDAEGELMFVQETMSTHGWKILIDEINARMATLQDVIDVSNDPHEVFACTKEKNGITYLINTAQEIVSKGNKARKRLQQMSD